MALPFVIPRRIFAATRDADGGVAIPKNGTVLGQARAIWQDRFPCTLAGRPGWEFREPNGDRLFIVVRIASVTLPAGLGGGNGIIGVWFGNALTKFGNDDFGDGVRALVESIGDIKRTWAVEWDATNNVFGSNALDADGTAVGTFVKNRWPAEWQLAQPSDYTTAANGKKTISTRTGRRFIPEFA